MRVNGAGAHKIQIARGDILAYTIGKATSYYKYDPDSKDAVGGFVAEGNQRAFSCRIIKMKGGLSDILCKRKCRKQNYCGYNKGCSHIYYL